MFEDLLGRLLSLPPVPAYAVIAALAGTENIFPPVPADTAVALGAFLAAAGGTISVWMVFLVTWSANVITAAGVYVGARTAGRSFARGRIGQRLFRPTAMARIEHLYDRFGIWGIFFSRFIPAVRAVVPPFAGLAGLDATRALLPMAIASAIWYGAITWVAANLLRHADDVAALMRGINRAGLVVGGLIVVVIAVLLFRHRRRQRRARDSASGQP